MPVMNWIEKSDCELCIPDFELPILPGIKAVKEAKYERRTEQGKLWKPQLCLRNKDLGPSSPLQKKRKIGICILNLQTPRYWQ